MKFASAQLSLLAFSLFLVHCTKHLDHAKVEDSIKTALSAKGVTVKSVDCPADRAVKSGDEFTCSGIDSDGDALVFRVTETDDQGTISWKMDGMIIDQSKLGEGIQDKVGHAADVQCASKTLIMKVGESFTCPATVNGKAEHVELTLQDDKGDVAWKLVK